LNTVPWNNSKSTSIKNRRQTVARLRLRGLTQRDVMNALNQQSIRDALANGIPATEAEQWSLGTINRDIKAVEAEWSAHSNAVLRLDS
jgi:hypothetical protein